MRAIRSLLSAVAALALVPDRNLVVTGFSASGMRRKKNAVKRSFHVVPSHTIGVLSMTATSLQEEDPLDIFQQARDFALADDVEFEEHYHPYRDYEQKLNEANRWLDEMAQLQANNIVDSDEAIMIVSTLHKKAKRYEKRMHKGERYVLSSVV